jgi:hypothetical protein
MKRHNSWTCCTGVFWAFGCETKGSSEMVSCLHNSRPARWWAACTITQGTLFLLFFQLSKISSMDLVVSLQKSICLSLFDHVLYLTRSRASQVSLTLSCLWWEFVVGAVIGLERSWGWYLDGDLIRSRISVGALSSEIIGKLKFKIGNYRLGYAWVKFAAVFVCWKPDHGRSKDTNGSAMEAHIRTVEGRGRRWDLEGIFVQINCLKRFLL